MRTGLGFDVHRFTKKRARLMVGGVSIPCGFGAKAVSDGDVVLHAVCDGILGAACCGDIGDYFPPDEKRCRGIDSKEIVSEVFKKTMKRFRLINCDIVIVAQKPRLVQYKKDITASLKRILKSEAVNVKIKSKEGLNILGGTGAIACFASVALHSVSRARSQKKRKYDADI